MSGVAGNQRLTRGTATAVAVAVKGIPLVKKLVLAALLCIAAIPLAAQVNDTYIIPVSVNAPGAFGTRWMTQLSVMNPQLDHDLVVSFTYIPTNGLKGFEITVPVP